MKEIEKGSHNINGVNPIKTNGSGENGYALSKFQSGHCSQSLESATVCWGMRKGLRVQGGVHRKSN
jgi:hypothetical protein